MAPRQASDRLTPLADCALSEEPNLRPKGNTRLVPQRCLRSKCTTAKTGDRGATLAQREAQDARAPMNAASDNRRRICHSLERALAPREAGWREGAAQLFARAGSCEGWFQAARDRSWSRGARRRGVHVADCPNERVEADLDRRDAGVRMLSSANDHLAPETQALPKRACDRPRHPSNDGSRRLRRRVDALQICFAQTLWRAKRRKRRRNLSLDKIRLSYRWPPARFRRRVKQLNRIVVVRVRKPLRASPPCALFGT